MPERSKDRINQAEKNEKITRQKYASLFGCSIRTAFNDIQHLVDKGDIHVMNLFSVQLACKNCT